MFEVAHFPFRHSRPTLFSFFAKLVFFSVLSHTQFRPGAQCSPVRKSRRGQTSRESVDFVIALPFLLLWVEPALFQHISHINLGLPPQRFPFFFYSGRRLCGWSYPFLSSPPLIFTFCWIRTLIVFFLLFLHCVLLKFRISFSLFSSLLFFF